MHAARAHPLHRCLYRYVVRRREPTARSLETVEPVTFTLGLCFFHSVNRTSH